MPDATTSLQSSTEALALSPEAVHLLEQKERIQQAIASSDPALILDTSKAFLESIFKTILEDRVGSSEIPSDFTPLFKAVRDSLPMSRDNGVADRLQRIAGSIVHNVGELRNDYGAASHGSDGYYQCPVQMDEAHMVVQFIDGLAGFIFSKHKASSDPIRATRIHYEDYPEFNSFWDEQYEGYELPFTTTEISVIPASEVLFKSDLRAYREALLQFLESEAEDEEDTQEASA
ncbi:MAG: abortive infection family protein [Verrucomicrobiota bacterium]